VGKTVQALVREHITTRTTGLRKESPQQMGTTRLPLNPLSQRWKMVDATVYASLKENLRAKDMELAHFLKPRQ